MLSPELLKKIRRIHITSSKVVDSMMAGHYRSAFRGSGMEFEEVREYVPGDEIRTIDWKVTARMGRPYIKRFREEREQVIMLVVDMSRSGLFGTQEKNKRETITELASILAFHAVKNQDRVGVVLFTRDVERHIPPKRGAAHVWRVIREILTFTPNYRGTDMTRALDFMGRVCRKKTITFLISDFLGSDPIPSLKRLGKRHDIIAVPVTDPGDFILPKAGILGIRDLETGTMGHVDCSDRLTRSRFTQMQQKAYATVLAALKRAGIDSMEISTDKPPTDALYRFFRIREKRARA
ncbi:DUF58 domain-containing protein [Desulfoplanes sp.]